MPDVNFQEAMEAIGIKPAFIDENTDIEAELGKRMRRPTNTEFISEIMDFCPFGAIGQIIVIQAVQQFSEQVAAASLEELEHPLIPPEAYKRCAEWIIEQYNKQYGKD